MKCKRNKDIQWVRMLAVDGWLAAALHLALVSLYHIVVVAAAAATTVAVCRHSTNIPVDFSFV